MVDASHLVSPSVVPLPSGAGPQRVVTAYSLDEDGLIVPLEQGKHYSVNGDEVVWDGEDRTSDQYAVFFVG